MGCNCIRDHQVKNQNRRSNAIASGKIKPVSIEVLASRLNTCRGCPFATKNPHPKYEKFGGMTNQSKCIKAKLPLLDSLKDPGFSCPEKKFS